MRKNNFSYDLKYYIISILAMIILWVGAFRLYHAPKFHERINIFFAGNVKSYALEKELLDYFGDSLLQVNLYSSEPSSMLFADKYQGLCFQSCDVAIIPLSVASITDCKNSFYEVTNNSINEFFIQEEMSLGIYLNDNNIENLSKFFEFSEERYIIVAIGSSVNYGGVTNNGRIAIDWLLRYGNF